MPEIIEQGLRAGGGEEEGEGEDQPVGGAGDSGLDGGKLADCTFIPNTTVNVNPLLGLLQ